MTAEGFLKVCQAQGGNSIKSESQTLTRRSELVGKMIFKARIIMAAAVALVSSTMHQGSNGADWSRQSFMHFIFLPVTSEEASASLYLNK